LEERYKSSNANKRICRRLVRSIRRDTERCLSVDISDENSVTSELSMNTNDYSSSSSASYPSRCKNMVDTSASDEVVGTTSSTSSSIDSNVMKPDIRCKINSLLKDLKKIPEGRMKSRNHLSSNMRSFSKLLQIHEESKRDHTSLLPITNVSLPIWYENECGAKIDPSKINHSTSIEYNSIKDQEVCLTSMCQHKQHQHVHHHRSSLDISTRSEYDIFNRFIPLDDDDWMLLKTKSLTAGNVKQKVGVSLK
jgi:hypothetical protein